MSRIPRNLGEAASNFFANWGTYEASFTEKVRLAVRNNAKKARTGRPCCGNHGEPGC